MDVPGFASVLTTGGGLVFNGDPMGIAAGHDADTGKLIWSFNTGSGMRGGIVSYAVDGEQYILVAEWLGILRSDPDARVVAAIGKVPSASTLIAFKVREVIPPLLWSGVNAPPHFFRKQTMRSIAIFACVILVFGVTVQPLDADEMPNLERPAKLSRPVMRSSWKSSARIATARMAPAASIPPGACSTPKAYSFRLRTAGKKTVFACLRGGKY